MRCFVLRSGHPAEVAPADPAPRYATNRHGQWTCRVGARGALCCPQFLDGDRNSVHPRQVALCGDLRVHGQRRG
eukprot:9249390-Lingulodinium_polyedra.AAC.1